MQEILEEAQAKTQEEGKPNPDPFGIESISLSDEKDGPEYISPVAIAIEK